MGNELLFFVHLSFIALASLAMLRVGRRGLVALMTLWIVLANLLVTKQIVLFGLHVTATDAFGVGIFFCSNLIQEYYGRDAARRAGIATGMCAVIYAAATLIHLWYVPSGYDDMHHHFDAVLSPMARLVLASFATYAVVQVAEYFFYAALQRRTQGRYLVLRNAFSLATTQLLDTVLFTFLGLYGTVSHLGHVIVVSYIIKLAAIACMVPFLSLSRFFTRRR